MRTLAALVAATALILLGGCTKDPGTPTSSPTPAVSAPTDPTPAGSPPATTEGPSSTETVLVPGADCLKGTWRLVRFVGRGGQSTYGTGQGGDVTVAFDDGRYTLAGQGQKPFTVNLAGSAAALRVDGTVAGTYQPDGAEMTFTIGEATGQGTLQAGNQTQSVPMAQVSQVIAPSGKATLACPKGELLLIALPTVRLELER